MRQIFVLAFVVGLVGCDEAPVTHSPEEPETPLTPPDTVIPGENPPPDAGVIPPEIVDSGVLDASVEPVDAGPPPPPPLEPNPLTGLATGSVQLDQLCARGRVNAITAALCARPVITQLAQLQTALGLSFGNRTFGNGFNGNPGFAIAGHSSALVARSTSSINPHAIVFNNNRFLRQDRNLVFMGFTRGDTLVELAVSTPGAAGVPSELTFYLLKFDVACEQTETCVPGDVLTSAVERDWKGWTLYEDTDIENTIYDCLHCHQSGGPTTPKILRMQEIDRPWTHWFQIDIPFFYFNPGGQAMLDDFFAAHGRNEDYGPIPAALIDDSNPQLLENLLISMGFGAQPNEFRSDVIEAEVRASASGQPRTNVPAGTSATWTQIYESAVAGNQIPPPYHDVKATDPIKLAAAIAAYQRVVNGTMPRADLPDIRDVFLESALPALSMRPKPGLDGRGIIVHMCAQCHNARLNQEMGRSRFDATNLDAMSDSAKEYAIARMLMDPRDHRAMPPKLFRELSVEERDLAIAELAR